MNGQRLEGIKACVFDAYGTLFDVGNISQAARDELPGCWHTLAGLWRATQLQYTWLRGLAGHHADFWQVTGEALDFAMDSLNIHGEGLRARLMDQYLKIAAYGEVGNALAQLQARGLRLAILSNGTPAMLDAALVNAGIAGYFEAVLSVEDVGVYKPHPNVYGLAPQRLGIPRDSICFVSSNGWDAWGAKAFGFRVLWCNRSAQTSERLPGAPDGQIADLSALPACLVG